MSAARVGAFCVASRYSGCVARTAVARTASAEAGMWAARAHAPPASGVASNLPSPCRVMSAAAEAMSPTPVILSVLRDW